ncbi:hypothetical protein EO087_15140 [Dyella sp. M7H15-1]|uniref:DUF6444 domain-containing protein n=1 Tax=Dyella sp. M7H15-1 TaxID=2501295 RepID=UPI0010050198|nr:DUF6444 domain-containing protein [Dyella sp. M7H15-1]QAU25160.1 hypothetical protein EO087_15140 [Dyella sp. M7H15-1]
MVTAKQGAVITAQDYATVWAESGSTVNASGRAVVHAYRGATVNAHGGPTVTVYRHSHVTVGRGATAILNNDVALDAKKGAFVQLPNGALVVVTGDTHLTLTGHIMTADGDTVRVDAPGDGTTIIHTVSHSPESLHDEAGNVDLNHFGSVEQVAQPVTIQPHPDLDLLPPMPPKPPSTSALASKLPNTVEGCHELIGELVREYRVLRARVRELEEQLKLDSHTSFKPPSSDGPGADGRRPGKA